MVIIGVAKQYGRAADKFQSANIPASVRIGAGSLVCRRIISVLAARANRCAEVLDRFQKPWLLFVWECECVCNIQLTEIEFRGTVVPCSVWHGRCGIWGYLNILNIMCNALL